LKEYVEFIDQPDRLKKVLKLLGAKLERGGMKASQIPVFGNALNAILVGQSSSIDVIN